MRLSKRHTEQAPAVSTPFGSLRYHRTSSVGSGQNYTCGLSSFHPHEAGGGQSGTPVGKNKVAVVAELDATGWIKGVRWKKLAEDIAVRDAMRQCQFLEKCVKIASEAHRRAGIQSCRPLQNLPPVAESPRRSTHRTCGSAYLQTTNHI